MDHPLIAMAVAAVGSVVSFVSGIFSAANGSEELIPWAQVGGSSISVVLLGYMAKKMLDGELVAQPIAKVIEDGERRETVLVDLVQDSKERESDLRHLLLMAQKREDRS